MKVVNPEGEDATDQAPSVKGFVNMSISSVLIILDKTRKNINARALASFWGRNCLLLSSFFFLFVEMFFLYNKSDIFMDLYANFYLYY